MKAELHANHGFVRKAYKISTYVEMICVDMFIPA